MHAQSLLVAILMELRETRAMVGLAGRKGDRVALDIEKLKADVAALIAVEKAAEESEKADLQLIADNIASLKAQLANGVSVTQADLDALDSQVQSVTVGVQGIAANLDAAAQPALVPVPDLPPAA